MRKIVLNLFLLVILCLGAGDRGKFCFAADDKYSWTLLAKKGWDLSARSCFMRVVKDGKIYIMGGMQGSSIEDRTVFNDVWSSVDGEHWTLITSSAAWPARKGHVVESFNGKMILSGGCKDYYAEYVYNDVWSSVDGEHWQLVTFLEKKRGGAPGLHILAV
jgi:N-acetylneuraminic acid mutarotase